MQRIAWSAELVATFELGRDAGTGLDCVVTRSANHHEILRREADRWIFIDRHFVMHVELASAGQKGIAQLAAVPGLDPGKVAGFLPSISAVKGDALAHGREHSTPEG
jgi:hypothetical protein